MKSGLYDLYDRWKKRCERFIWIVVLTYGKHSSIIVDTRRHFSKAVYLYLKVDEIDGFRCKQHAAIKQI